MNWADGIDFDALASDPIDEPLLPIIPHEHGGTLTLRDYQQEGVEFVYRELQTHRSALMVWATGLGKTIAAAEICARWPESAGRILFLAHRKELIDQAAQKIGLHTDDECNIEMNVQSELRKASFYGKSKVLVGSVATMCRMNRLRQFNPADFGLVIIDEAHHATAATFKRIIGWFQQNQQCRFLGITATPDRADGVEMGEIFEVVAHERNILDGINAGWLVPVLQKYVVVDGLDFSSVRTTAGDLNGRDLERLMAGASADELGADGCDLTEDQLEARKKQEQMLHAVADPTIREADGRPGIVFCVTIDHAEKMAAVFRRYGVTAETVTQNTSQDVREQNVRDFKAGRLQFLVGCTVFTEGFDAPNAAVISMARPTKSRSLYTQCVGRATRPDLDAIQGLDDEDSRRWAIENSGKPNCTVLDFVGNSGRHKLISTADILGEAYPEDLREHVIALLRHNANAVDIQEELEAEQKRREEMARLKAAEDERRREAAAKRAEELRLRLVEEARLRKLRAEAQYRTREVDAFGDRAEHQQRSDGFRGGATDKQVDHLVALGVEYKTALAYGSRQAGAVIDSLRSRTGGEWRVFFGKHKGKSLKEAGSGFQWWVESQMDDGDLRTRIMQNIELMKAEQAIR